MYTLEKHNTSPLCILYKLMREMIPLLILTLVHTWHEESIPRDDIYHEGAVILCPSQVVLTMF
jgi:hypothetical protein